LLVYIKAVHFGSIAFSYSILCQSAFERGTLAVSFDTCYLYEMFVVYPVQFVTFCATSAFAYARQEFAFRSLIFTLFGINSTFWGFVEMLQFENLRLLRIFVGVVIAVVFVAFVSFESFNMFSKKKAAAHLKKDEENYNTKWAKLSKDTTIGHPHPAKALSDEIRKSFKKVLEDPNAPSPWFRRQPRVLQEHSSVDSLFDDVELVDVAFQQLVHCWINVSLTTSTHDTSPLRVRAVIVTRSAGMR
jgi:hypothetical protein